MTTRHSDGPELREQTIIGENLRRAHPVVRDGTFSSFLLLLEDVEPVDANPLVPDPQRRRG
jgi:hypothetical protein